MNSISNTNITLQRDILQSSEYKDELEYIKKCEAGVLFEGSRIAVASPKVSIVIPVFNKVKYLDLALRSAQNQTMRDLEIVCVDDGSTDGSVAKIESYIKDDPRIRLVKNKINRGTGYTRVNAVKSSNGEYILSLDPDDAFASPKIAELAYNKAKENDADIVHFKWLQEKNGVFSKLKWADPKKFNAVIEQPNIYDMILGRHNCQGKLIFKETYKKALDLIGESILGKHIVFAEDCLQMMAVSMIAKKYIGLESYGYTYFIRQDSGMQTVEKDIKQRIKQWDDRLVVCSSLADICEKRHEMKNAVSNFFKNSCISNIKKTFNKISTEQFESICQKVLLLNLFSDEQKEEIKNSITTLVSQKD